MKLSVVIPVYNEEDNIGMCLDEVYLAFPQAEVIVVNDASTDTTLAILNTLQLTFKNLRIINNLKNHGHGFSVVRGLYAATGDYILYIDADRQISLERFIPFGDVTSGWRVGRYDKPFRKVISFCLKMTNLFRYGYFIRDANCPFKIYKRTKIQPLLKELPVSYIIPIACLEVLARKHKLICSTIPTPHMPYKGVREGKLQSINRVSIKFFWDAFKEAISL